MIFLVAYFHPFWVPSPRLSLNLSSDINKESVVIALPSPSNNRKELPFRSRVARTVWT